MTGVGVTFGACFGFGFGDGLGLAGGGVGGGVVTGAATTTGAGAGGVGLAITTFAAGEGGGGSVQMSTADGSGSVGCGPVGAIVAGGSPLPGPVVPVGVGAAAPVGQDSPTVTLIPPTPTPRPWSQTVTVTAVPEEPDEAIADPARPAGSATAAAQTPKTVSALRPVTRRRERGARPADVPRRRMCLLLPVRTLTSAPLMALSSVDRLDPRPRPDQFEPGADRNWLSGVESAWITP